MDPLSLAMMAFGAIKQGVAIYKEVSGTAHDVHSIVSDLGEHVGAFFDHQEKAIEHLKEKEKNPPRDRSESAVALDNILARKRLENAETELRELLIYHAPPELGAVWDDFQKERDRLRAKKAKEEERERKAELARQIKRKAFADKWHLRFAIMCAVLCVSFVMSGVMYAIHTDYEARKRANAKEQEFFERSWETDPRVVECWKIVKETNMLPKFCQ